MSDFSETATEAQNRAESCRKLPLDCIEPAEIFPQEAEIFPAKVNGGHYAFRWTTAARKAAALVAEDQIQNDAIARTCLISRRTLTNWKQHPEFRAEVEKHKHLTAADVLDYSIARKIERVRALDARWAKMHQVIEARAADMPYVPGGPSGLLVREIKSIGAGLNSREVEEYKVDTGLLKELREHERQAAIEVGQWQEQAGALKPGEARLTVTYDAIQAIQQSDPDRWRRIEAAAQAIAAEERGLPAGRLVVEEGSK